MSKYAKTLVAQIRELRAAGKTYREIRNTVNVNIPKSTFSDLCRGVNLPTNYQIAIDRLNLRNLGKARTVALAMREIKRKEFSSKVETINHPIANRILENDVAKIALSMLCLGEASKYKPGASSFSLGNSDSRIIIIFLELLKKCFDFHPDKVRCTVQCRADQNIPVLEEYWHKVTKIPKSLFYKALVDPRTVGKPTRRKGYMGVLRVDYLDRKVQLELESLAQLTYNQVLKGR